MGRAVSQISIGIATLTFVIAVVLFALNVSGAPNAVYSWGSNWGSMMFDPLSTLMAMVISGISLIVRVYSVRYMAEEAGYGRFFVLLDLMAASLILMVAAGDLIMLLVAWHLVGVILYFLLGHDNRSHSAFRYSFWTFITYRFGDVPMVIAAVLLFQATGSWSLNVIFDFVAQNPDATTYFGLSLTETVSSLIAVSAFARSAQFILHIWLPYTMEGPTPVSALMHAGIVNAGGIIINRFAPIFVHTNDILHWLFIVGLITAVIGSVLMLSQSDIKKALGYSTMGQMGFMIMEVGLGAFSLAIFHLIAHGLFKGTLFLSAGNVIGEARNNDGIPKDDLYTFIVERRSPKVRQPWLIMAMITLIVPVVVLFAAHYFVSADFIQKQGAIILLFFGWVTGAQLLFSTYSMRSSNPWRLIALIVFSFIVVVIGYTVISHAFDSFLYPDQQFGDQLYAAAGIDLGWFITLISVLAIIIIIGWLRVYYTHSTYANKSSKQSHVWMNFYALVSREFYMTDLFASLNRKLLALAAKLNVWFKWC
ncbi:NADH-quinone oxidoreductase subunit L [Thiomicrorhabdus sediminis]|uniref:NADH-quinone oxidoreductase subunit L n=2 Tax=Thiomicrorhabdus sediminis TaxID=2580412 RepID=A0A4P9K9U9_9GAMM|nr:NADH-quinone oxidoreductase subunit L [Thiomicrorhabdus sediminis]